MKLLCMLSALVFGIVLCPLCFAEPLIFQVRQLEVELKQDADADIKTVVPSTEVPEDATLVWSAEVAVEPGSTFYCKTTVGDRTVKIEGSVKKREDGKFDVEYFFSYSKVEPSGIPSKPLISAESAKRQITLTEGQQLVSNAVVSKGKSKMCVMILKKRKRKSEE